MKSSQSVIKFFSLGICLSSFIFSPFVLDFTLISRFVCCTLFLGLSVYSLYLSDHTFKLKADLVVLSLLSYVAFSGISIFWSLNKAEALFDASKLLMALFVFLLSCFSFKFHYDLFMNYLRKISVFLFYLTLISAVYQYYRTDTSIADWRYSLSGLNGHKNLYASFLFLNLFFLISAYRNLPAEWRPLIVLALILSLFIVIFLKTKAVWLGLLATAITFGFIHLLKPKDAVVRWKTVLVIVVGVLVANVFFLVLLQPLVQYNLNPAVGQQVKSLVDTERLMLWDKTYHLINHHYFFGTGAGNWQIYFPNAGLNGLWRAEDLNYTFQRPHNDFLWILSQTGIIGFNLFLLFLFSVLVLFTKALRFIDTASFSEAALCLAFIVGYYLISFFDFPMERIEHLIWIHILLALAYHHIRNTLQLKTFATIAVSRPVYMVALVLIVSISTLGVFRYQGELNTRRMYDAKKAGATIEIKKLGQSAKNFAYTIDPTSIPIDWYIGNANAALGNYPEAKKDFLKAYHYNPYNRNVLNDLASAYSVNHNTDSAKILYQEASRISPRFDDPKLNLAAIYIKEGNVEKTSECLENMYHDSPRRTQYQKIVEAMKKK